MYRLQLSVKRRVAPGRYIGAFHGRRHGPPWKELLDVNSGSVDTSSEDVGFSLTNPSILLHFERVVNLPLTFEFSLICLFDEAARAN
jgi:hypothetical protein